MSYQLAKDYAAGKLHGWAETIRPGTVAKAWEQCKGSFLEFDLRNTDPKKMFLHEVVWKASPDAKSKETVVPDYYPQEIGDCVSFGAKHATEIITWIQIALGGQLELYRPVFAPYYYGTGRLYVGHSGGYQDGSSGTWMAEAVMKYGTLFSDEIGVPQYTGSVAKSWGASSQNGIDKWKDKAGAFPVQSAALIKTWEDLVASISNGYAVTTASNVGYDMEASSDGFHRQRGSWSHQMCFIGVDETYTEPYALILNNWGDVHGRLKDFQNGTMLPKGILRVRRADAMKHINAAESFAYSNFKAMPEQPLDRLLFKFI